MEQWRATSRRRPLSGAPKMASRYQKRRFGPLMVRIDIHVEVPGVELTLRAERQAER